jgi:murein L,D-transpeptidase YafK
LRTARRVRALAALAAIASAVALAASGAHGFPTPAKHLKPLPASLISEVERKEMTTESPILVRIFKQEAELEVWKQDRSGKYALLKIYPICRWSGELGPKIRQGDRQAPEGFYAITPGQMNPNSSYYLSFNIGYPNAFDRAHERTGSALMVHGDCLSAGCYAMTDEQMSEIFALAREAFAGGQPSFQVQALPFRMNALNMARHRNNPNMPSWKNLKQGYDYFELTRQQPKVDVCEKRYVFNAKAPNSSSKVEFIPADTCPAYEVPNTIASAVQAKARRDEAAALDLIKRGTPAAPIRTGEDGGMHPVFVASLKRPSLWDPAGIFGPKPASAPGTVPPHVNPPKNASPIYAPTMAYAPEAVSDSTGSVPVPRPAPRKDGSGLQVASFADRFGPFLTASLEPASIEREQPGFRLASADSRPVDTNPAAQQLLRSARPRVASAGPALPAEDSAAPAQEISLSSRSKIASALSRLLGIGREANATERAKSEAASPPSHTGAIAARPEQSQSQPHTAALFEKTTMAEMKVLTAQPVVSSANFESRWSAIR